ncbi:MAG: hypothetical protein RLY43_600 [Bacteroidota bacterium]|jgi:hypothetical protein
MFSHIGSLRHRDVGTTPPITGGVLQLGTPGNIEYGQPIVYADNYGRDAMIFTTAELGAAKTITALEFYFRSFGTPVSYPNQLIKMGNVVQSQFDSAPDMTFADMTVTGLITVKNTFTQLINTNNVWYTLTLDTPFVYDGTKNLLIVWDNNWGSWSSNTGGTSYMTATNAVAKKSSASSPITGNGTRSSNRPVIKIHY